VETALGCLRREGRGRTENGREKEKKKDLSCRTEFIAAATHR